ncbi:hypothetical protein [Arthrobacter sp. MDT1-65]
MPSPPRSRDTADTPAPKDLSDRQAVIAVMVGGGLAPADVAVVLSLPLGTVEEELQQAMRILALADIDDLSDDVVAAHYDSVPPGPQARHGFTHVSRTLGPDVAVVLTPGVTVIPPAVPPTGPVHPPALLHATARRHTYPRFETVCFLRPSNASYLEATDMLRSARREVEKQHLHGSEYVLGVEVWGDETHGAHDYRGRRVDLTGGADTLYWYRVTITDRPPAGNPDQRRA